MIKPTTSLLARLIVIAALALSALPISTVAQESEFDPSTFSLNLELVVDGLNSPVQFVDANDDSGRMFVVQQTGQVRILDGDTLLETPFLDISGSISTGSEQGLLSIALHPAFAENGQFFIDYTDTAGNTRIERWTVSGDDPNIADSSVLDLLSC